MSQSEAAAPQLPTTAAPTAVPAPAESAESAEPVAAPADVAPADVAPADSAPAAVAPAELAPAAVTPVVATQPAAAPVEAVEAVEAVASAPSTAPAAITALPTAVVPVQATSASAGLSFGEQLVQLASTQAGKPYVYGAAGPNSFDCSGLVQYLYQQLGKTVPRVTDAQYAASTKISQDAKQPGDLIFFGSPGNIYHVGIYAGNNQMWHAPHTGDVVKLADIYTTTYYVGRIS